MSNPSTSSPEAVGLSWVRGWQITLAAGLVAAVASTFVGLGASRWIGRTFPSFLLLQNGVVASVGRPEWASAQHGGVYQTRVVAVAGEPVSTSSEVYRKVASRPVGPVDLSFRHGLNEVDISLRSAEFSRRDYWTVFGAYLLTGFLYLASTGLSLAFVSSRPLSHALALVGATGGIFALSGVGIYEPEQGMRLHAFAEALFPAALLHLAVVCSRTPAHMARAIIALGWWAGAMIGLAYQLLLEHPMAYSAFHATSEAYMALAGGGLVATLLFERYRAEAGPLARSILTGALLGLGVPAIIMGVSGTGGGTLPVNYVTTTAFLFPLCFGVGILRQRRSTIPLQVTPIAAAPHHA